MEIVKVLVAAAGSWLFGAVWYMALAKPWMAAANVPTTGDGRPVNAKNPTPYLLSALSMVLVAGMMRQNGIRNDPARNIAPNLLQRGCLASGPNKNWPYADASTTCPPTVRRHHLCLDERPRPRGMPAEPRHSPRHQPRRSRGPARPLRSGAPPGLRPDRRRSPPRRASRIRGAQALDDQGEGGRGA